jgi:hypothetical protein
MCFCLSAYVSGGKKGFLGGIFWVFGTICEKNRGVIFLWGKLYMFYVVNLVATISIGKILYV